MLPVWYFGDAIRRSTATVTAPPPPLSVARSKIGYRGPGLILNVYQTVISVMVSRYGMFLHRLFLSKGFCARVVGLFEVSV